MWPVTTEREVPDMYARFQPNLEFLQNFRMEISVTAALILVHAERIHMTTLTGAFRDHTDAPNTPRLRLTCIVLIASASYGTNIQQINLRS
jgi:hypothetical protein